jgi:hypothetical protein
VSSGWYHRADSRRSRRSTGRRAFLLAVYLVVTIGTPVGHGLLLGIHLLREHSPLRAELARATFRDRLQATLEATRLEWAREFGFDDPSPVEHRHGEGEPHVHAAATTASHAHWDAGIVDALAGSGSGGDHANDAGGQDVPGGAALAIAGEHAHGGFVHSHEDDQTARDLALLMGGLFKQLLPDLPSLPSPIIGLVAAAWASSEGSLEVFFPVPLPPPELV